MIHRAIIDDGERNAGATRYEKRSGGTLPGRSRNDTDTDRAPDDTDDTGITAVPVLMRRRALRPPHHSRSARTRPGSRAAGGFSLIELVIAIVALAALGAGIAAVFVEGPAASADPQIRAQARAIAEGYMEEILLKAYANPEPGTPETGRVETEGGSEETRAEYDDVWDYCDIGGNNDCSQGSESPTDQDGSAMAGGALDDYTVEIRITGDPTVSDPDPAEITVIVSHRSGTVNYELVSQRADY